MTPPTSNLQPQPSATQVLSLTSHGNRPSPSWHSVETWSTATDDRFQSQAARAWFLYLLPLLRGIAVMGKQDGAALPFPSWLGPPATSNLVQSQFVWSGQSRRRQGERPGLGSGGCLSQEVRDGRGLTAHSATRFGLRFVAPAGVFTVGDGREPCRQRCLGEQFVLYSCCWRETALPLSRAVIDKSSQ